MGILLNSAHDALSRNLFVGVAGWSISAQQAAELPRNGSQLERYAQRLNAVEINTSFYKSHRIETYIRWAASTPPGFRFAVKVPRTITDDRRLVDCDQLLEAFGGCRDVRYYRWHGSPTIYFSKYEYAALNALQAQLRGDAASGASAWCIFDNTGLGAAWENALTLQNLLV